MNTVKLIFGLFLFFCFGCVEKKTKPNVYHIVFEHQKQWVNLLETIADKSAIVTPENLRASRNYLLTSPLITQEMYLEHSPIKEKLKQTGGLNALSKAFSEREKTYDFIFSQCELDDVPRESLSKLLSLEKEILPYYEESLNYNNTKTNAFPIYQYVYDFQYKWINELQRMLQSNSPIQPKDIITATDLFQNSPSFSQEFYLNLADSIYAQELTSLLVKKDAYYSTIYQKCSGNINSENQLEELLVIETEILKYYERKLENNDL
ncbi:hypothetical protein [Persicobacter diffluens]|uniref:Uncharacterized protein n=1 Tax=Persicobacter diffluens TaxID=981 RepID=A0AAN4W463_9BACT|nr:hypothetical protein PEDI_54800 [Persicobacter diffluens]